MRVLQTLQSDTDAQQLALALAKNKLGHDKPPSELLAELGIDELTVRSLLNNPSFKALVQQTKQDLEQNNEGIKLKSAIALEDSIAQFYRLIHDPDTPANVVVQAGKLLSDMSGATKAGSTDTQTGPQFVLHLDLSGLDAARESQAALTKGQVQVLENSK